ncbi:MAG: hypothetical protein H6Q90_2617 [Deltaproteobacteria bacterium]|nr:hypothetical protein [Deltaproteobacteria bacterium]
MDAPPSLRFRVESLLERLGIVFACQLDAGDFRLGPLSTLGGHRVLGFDVPRKLREDGSPDLALFGFRLERRQDVAGFVVGSIVQLVQ